MPPESESESGASPREPSNDEPWYWDGESYRILWPSPRASSDEDETAKSAVSFDSDYVQGIRKLVDEKPDPLAERMPLLDLLRPTDSEEILNTGFEGSSKRAWESRRSEPDIMLRSVFLRHMMGTMRIDTLSGKEAERVAQNDLPPNSAARDRKPVSAEAIDATFRLLQQTYTTLLEPFWIKFGKNLVIKWKKLTRREKMALLNTSEEPLHPAFRSHTRFMYTMIQYRLGKLHGSQLAMYHLTKVPLLNVEDLMRGNNLVTLMQSRCTHPPSAFAHSDLEQMRLWQEMERFSWYCSKEHGFQCHGDGPPEQYPRVVKLAELPDAEMRKKYFHPLYTCNDAVMLSTATDSILRFVGSMCALIARGNTGRSWKSVLEEGLRISEALPRCLIPLEPPDALALGSFKAHMRFSRYATPWDNLRWSVPLLESMIGQFDEQIWTLRDNPGDFLRKVRGAYSVWRDSPADVPSTQGEQPTTGEASSEATTHEAIVQTMMFPMFWRAVFTTIRDELAEALELHEALVKELDLQNQTKRYKELHKEVIERLKENRDLSRLLPGLNEEGEWSVKDIMEAQPKLEKKLGQAIEMKAALKSNNRKKHLDSTNKRVQALATKELLEDLAEVHEWIWEVREDMIKDMPDEIRAWESPWQCATALSKAVASVMLAYITCKVHMKISCEDLPEYASIFDVKLIRNEHGMQKVATPKNPSSHITDVLLWAAHGAEIEERYGCWQKMDMLEMLIKDHPPGEGTEPNIPPIFRLYMDINEIFALVMRNLFVFQPWMNMAMNCKVFGLCGMKKMQILIDRVATSLETTDKAIHPDFVERGHGENEYVRGEKISEEQALINQAMEARHAAFWDTLQEHLRSELGNEAADLMRPQSGRYKRKAFYETPDPPSVQRQRQEKRRREVESELRKLRSRQDAVINTVYIGELPGQRDTNDGRTTGVAIAREVEQANAGRTPRRRDMPTAEDWDEGGASASGEGGAGGADNDTAEDPEEAALAAIRAEPIYLKSRDLRRIRPLFNWDGGESARSLNWSQFERIMGDIGFQVLGAEGSRIRFVAQRGEAERRRLKPIVLHQPHGGGKMEWAKMKQVGGDLTREYGWTWETFQGVTERPKT